MQKISYNWKFVILCDVDIMSFLVDFNTITFVYKRTFADKLFFPCFTEVIKVSKEATRWSQYN